MDQPVENKPQLPYEDKPINFRIVLKAVAGLLLVAALVHLIIWFEFRELDAYKKQADPRVSPLQPQRYIPPGPHLEAQRPAMQGLVEQPFDPKNLAASRAQETNVLESYAWVNEKSGVVRIPVRVAMKRFVEQEAQKQKLQTQTQPGAATH